MKAATKQQEQLLEPGFLAFRLRHDLSERELSRACGGFDTRMSKSTVHRICLNNTKPKHFDRFKERIQELVTEFLESRNFTKDQITAEITALFFGEEIDTMQPNRTELDRTTQKHFGLKRDPFALFPRDASEVFTCKELDNVLARVEDAVKFQGFLAVVGDIGTGKTVLKARLQELAEDGDEMKLVWPSFFDMSDISASSIVIEVLRAFDHKIPHNKIDRKRAMIALLRQSNDDGVNVALVIDEAHRLNDKVLSALKNFYEMLGVKYRKFIGIVMFGQPMLQGRLREVRFQEIAERLQVVKMPPIRKRAAEYLQHRLQLAGGDLTKLFDTKVIEALTSKATTPLQLGNLANQALQEAYDRGEKVVQVELLQKAMPGLFVDDEPRLRSTSRPLLVAK